MTGPDKKRIQVGVVQYLTANSHPAKVSEITASLRTQSGLDALRDADVRDVVQPMIVSGKLNYTPSLKVELATQDK